MRDQESLNQRDESVLRRHLILYMRGKRLIPWIPRLPRHGIVRLPEGADWDPPTVTLKAIREVVAGRGESGHSREQAMAVLMASDFPNKHRDFQSLLENGSESRQIRHLAARYIGMTNTPAAMEILIQNTEIRDEYVRAGVVRALGRIGDTSALPAVLGVKEEGGGRAAAQAAFAAALISHRWGLEGNDLAFPAEEAYVNLPTSGTRDIEIASAGEEGAEFCLRSLATEPFGVEFAEQPMYELRIGQALSMLVLNRDVLSGSPVRYITRRKAFLGVIAYRTRAGLYPVGLLVLTAPSKKQNEVGISLCTTEGAIVFGGRGVARQDGVAFSIATVSGSKASPVSIRGVLEGGGLEFETAIVGHRSGRSVA
jgi:hypothetical protein